MKEIQSYLFLRVYVEGATLTLVQRNMTVFCCSGSNTLSLLSHTATRYGSSNMGC